MDRILRHLTTPLRKLAAARFGFAALLLCLTFAAVPIASAKSRHNKVKIPSPGAMPETTLPDLPSVGGGEAPSENAGSYIVVLKKGNPARLTAADHSRRYGASVKNVYGSVFKGYAATVPASKLDALKHDRRVAYVARDLPVQAAAQSLPTGVNRIDGDLSGLKSGDGTGSVSNLKVAVLDSGSGPHTDLNVVGGKACNGTDYNDGNGHGTHVAGTIGAKDDGNGVVGVAPGVPIYSVRVLDNSLKGTTAQLVCGIDWVTANAVSLGIKVANLSLEMAGTDDGNCGNTNNDPVHKAICASVAKGVTYVVAAGNSAVDFASTVPAAYNEVLTATAVADANGTPGSGGTFPNQCSPDVDDTAADFSNFTAPNSSDVAHTIAAPGKCVNSTWKGGGYGLSSGTSMAAPHVAGVVALCITLGKCNTTPDKIIVKLRADAAAQTSSFGFQNDPLRPLTGKYYGYLINAGFYR
jgi:subtilisin family serine protease